MEENQDGLKMVSVAEMLLMDFNSLPIEDRIFIRDSCHYRPDIFPTLLNEKDKIVKSSKVYKDFPWIIGSHMNNLYYCFPCLLYTKHNDKKFKQTSNDISMNIYAKSGVVNPHKTGGKHSRLKQHMKYNLQLAMLGKVTVHFLN